MTSPSRVWLNRIICLLVIFAGAINPAESIKDGRKGEAIEEALLQDVFRLQDVPWHQRRR